MPDITNLKPEIIAQFWIYIIGALGVGFAAGFALTRFNFKSRRESLESERKLFESERKLFESEKQAAADLKDSYEKLKADLEQNEKYWLYKSRSQ